MELLYFYVVENWSSYRKCLVDKQSGLGREEEGSRTKANNYDLSGRPTVVFDQSTLINAIGICQALSNKGNRNLVLSVVDRKNWDVPLWKPKLIGKPFISCHF